MSRVTFHSKSTSLGLGPEGPPPPPPMMIGGPTGPAVTVMVTSTVASPPFPSSAVTVSMSMAVASVVALRIALFETVI